MWIVAGLISGIVTIAVGELLIRAVLPQRSLYPRTQYSPSYGFLPYPNTRMVHEVPGRWRYEYTINEFGHRGPALPLSNAYPQPVVVALGDSYTFGVGVNDGEEYPAVMQRRFAGRVAVANVGVEGWGLTQEIRRFYELGQLYLPKVVVLQFCFNDPADNLLNSVTVVADGRFAFRDSTSGLESLKRFMSTSVLQKSQIYNLLRQVGYAKFREREVARQLRGAAVPAHASPGTPAADEAMHMSLLSVFAADLDRRGVRLIMFAVDGQLSRFPALHELTMSLHKEGRLRYVEMLDWFPKGDIETGPEGHWTAGVHNVIGERLATIVEMELARGAAAGAQAGFPPGRTSEVR